MAAYAALVSVMNIVEQIQDHPRLSFTLDNEQIDSLRIKVGFLQDFIEGNSHRVSQEAQVLEAQIASAAYAAEDVIESHVVDQILAESNGHGETSSGFLLDLQKVIEDMDSIKEKVLEVNKKMGFKDQQPTYSMHATSSPTLATGKNVMVGFDDELIQLLELLTGQQSNRQIISITGMGGIGKTTLARSVYENLFIVQHFDIRAWATVSHNNDVREILLELISCQRNQQYNGTFIAQTGDIEQETEDQLGEKFYKSLSGRRYLIILDDIWSIETWDKIKNFFPNNGSRSRIIVTTRLSDVAACLGSSSLAMNFLDEEKSWNLFREKAFVQEGCPPELEKIGKEIARKCQGLPLSIVVIGGVLGNSSRTLEYWENVAKDINSILNSTENEQCVDILSLSYNHLPAHLKPCFLYMGIFPEDHEIRVSRLIKLWVAEGFLKPNKSQSFEEVAEGYLKDLINMNLISVSRWGVNGKIKTCNIHDLLRNLCSKIAEKEKFLCIMNVLNIPRGIEKERRLVLDECIPLEKYHPQVFHALQSASRARSLICKGGWLSVKFKLLRILNMVDSDSVEAIFRQVNLRYLSYQPILISISKLPLSISLLWNLQTLIIKGGRFKQFVAPLEIWEMPQLRHLVFDEIYLPNPPCNQQDGIVLRHLQTLVQVVNFKLSEEVCMRIPNLKKLHMKFDGLSRKLQKLRLANGLFDLAQNLDHWIDLPRNLTFPSSLQKLTLEGSRLRWKDLIIIGSLPHLEVLKLKYDSVLGSKWNPIEGQFLRLKFLKIDFCSALIHWNADNSHFPVLENLVLEYLFNLDEIPLGIGEIPTLRLICLKSCSESSAISAVKILDEQESLGNEGLQVRIRFMLKEDIERFREKVDVERFTSNNLQIEYY